MRYTFPLLKFRISDVQSEPGVKDRAFLMIGTVGVFVYITNGMFIFNIQYKPATRGTFFKIAIHDGYGFVVTFRYHMHRCDLRRYLNFDFDNWFWRKVRWYGIRRPFKGSHSYEWQIKSKVYQLKYPNSNWYPERTNWSFKTFVDTDWTRQTKYYKKG